jgi:SAM-dependent MidA family methyltransferase
MISFETFMDRALHDPETGYYARRIKGVGRTGDFTTTPTLSAAPAKAIASWAAKALKETGTRHLIEIGPGEGRLSEDVLKRLPWHMRLRMKLHLVETSLPLQEIQGKRLGKRATWHRTPAEALAACGGKAVIFSNELVDAFPVRRFRLTASGWQEMGIRLQPLEEILLAPGPLPQSSSFTQPHPIGQQIEVHESYRNWLDGWLPLWKAGRMLTIDYGARATDIYHRRLHGTVRAYLFQQRLEGMAIYGNPGRQDITTDVNFTDLIEWSASWAGDESLKTFREFILPFVDPKNPADAAIANEEGSGGAFLVLDQKRIPEA